jgi:hypothetical protein
MHPDPAIRRLAAAVIRLARDLQLLTTDDGLIDDHARKGEAAEYLALAAATGIRENDIAEETEAALALALRDYPNLDQSRTQPPTAAAETCTIRSADIADARGPTQACSRLANKQTVYPPAADSQRLAVRGRLRKPVAVLTVSADGLATVRIDDEAADDFWCEVTLTREQTEWILDQMKREEA